MTSSECKARIDAAHAALAAALGDGLAHPTEATDKLRETVAQFRLLATAGPLPADCRDSLQDWQHTLRVGQQWNAEGLRATTERMHLHAERLLVEPAASYQSTGATSAVAWELHSRIAVEG